jgi:hypothetical protein
MVAITTLTAYSPSLHTGGSAVRQSAAPAQADAGDAETPATIVTLSDRAQQLVAEANAAQLVGDIFALANGVAKSGEGGPAKPRVLVAHDVQANEGLYIVWSSAE